jgi:hypothetical protein
MAMPDRIALAFSARSRPREDAVAPLWRRGAPGPNLLPAYSAPQIWGYAEKMSFPAFGAGGASLA